MTRYTEIVDSVESLKEFLDMNKITPSEIIVVWDEDDYLSTKNEDKTK